QDAEIGRLRPDRRLQHSGTSFHRREPRGRSLFLRLPAGPGDPGDGHVQALASFASGELRRYRTPVRWLFRRFLPQATAGRDGILRHGIRCNLCRDSPPHSADQIEMAPGLLHYLDGAAADQCGGLFLALFAMYESEKARLTWYALGLAAGY